MQINFVDLFKQYSRIAPEIDDAIQRVIKNSSFIGGEEVCLFEEEFAKYCRAQYCVGVNSGTDALKFICKTLDIKAGDEVILPTNTFIATALGVSGVGAIPVFVDCDAETYNIAWDTIMVQDPYQSWFAIGLGGGGVWDAANPHGIWMMPSAQISGFKLIFQTLLIRDFKRRFNPHIIR